MSDENRDVEVTSKGITLRGAYEDLRPAVKRSIAIVDNVLQVLENSVGLPADFLNHHLIRFRERYKQRLQDVPVENRELPSFRIGCSVLKEVAYSADEPDFQEMFANLLAAASDNRVADEAHPGFANIINQLTPLDAKNVKVIVGDPNGNARYEMSHYDLIHEIENENERDILASIDNLVRLGLIEWSIKGVEWHDLNRFRRDIGRSLNHHYGGFSRGLADVERELRGLNESVKTIGTSIEQLLNNVGEKENICATTLGRRFVRVCMPTQEASSE